MNNNNNYIFIIIINNNEATKTITNICETSTQNIINTYETIKILDNVLFILMTYFNCREKWEKLLTIIKNYNLMKHHKRQQDKDRKY